MTRNLTLILATGLLLAACKTTPDTDINETVEIETPPVQTCTPLSALEKVEIPAKTETFTTIVLIDNPPYDPIERREQQERIIEEAKVIYVDSEGREVIDICELIEEAGNVESSETAETEEETEPSDG